MKNKNTQKLTLAAMVAAAYAVLSLLGAVFGITYGPIQVRFSEALCLLPFLFPETAWGLGVGRTKKDAEQQAAATAYTAIVEGTGPMPDETA